MGFEVKDMAIRKTDMNKTIEEKLSYAINLLFDIKKEIQITKQNIEKL